MNRDLVRQVGNSPVDNLINSTTPPAITTGIRVRANQGVLRRGTVMSISSLNNEMVVLGRNAAGGETLTPNCILTDPVDTGTGAAVPSTAYRTGHFNRQALITHGGRALTRAEEETLRNGGILLSDALR